jgi:hypothetical protein
MGSNFLADHSRIFFQLGLWVSEIRPKRATWTEIVTWKRFGAASSNACSRWSRKAEGASLSRARDLSRFSTRTTSSSQPSIRRKVRKWKSVFVLNVVDGCMPSDLGAGTSAELEEERRLLYVAMTRAKDDLHLTIPQRFFTHGQNAQGDRHVYASRTRFIP